MNIRHILMLIRKTKSAAFETLCGFMTIHRTCSLPKRTCVISLTDGAPTCRLSKLFALPCVGEKAIREVWGGSLLACLERSFERGEKVHPMRLRASSGVQLELSTWPRWHTRPLAAQALPDSEHILDKQPVPDTTRRAAVLICADKSNHIGVDVEGGAVTPGDTLDLVQSSWRRHARRSLTGEAWNVAGSAVRRGVGDCGTHARKGRTSRPMFSWLARVGRPRDGSMPPSTFPLSVLTTKGTLR